MRGLVDSMAAEKGAAVNLYEKKVATLSQQLKASQVLVHDLLFRGSRIS